MSCWQMGPHQSTCCLASTTSAHVLVRGCPDGCWRCRVGKVKARVWVAGRKRDPSEGTDPGCLGGFVQKSLRDRSAPACSPIAASKRLKSLEKERTELARKLRESGIVPADTGSTSPGSVIRAIDEWRQNEVIKKGNEVCGWLLCLPPQSSPPCAALSLVVVWRVFSNTWVRFSPACLHLSWHPWCSLCAFSFSPSFLLIRPSQCSGCPPCAFLGAPAIHQRVSQGSLVGPGSSRLSRLIPPPPCHLQIQALKTDRERLEKALHRMEQDLEEANTAAAELSGSQKVADEARRKCEKLQEELAAARTQVFERLALPSARRSPLRKPPFPFHWDSLGNCPSCNSKASPTH